MTSEPSGEARARFVQVAVNSGRPTFMTFSYRVPHGREVEPGEVVHVPFGRQELQGVVVEDPTDLPGYSGDIRELLPRVEGAPRLDATQLQLASWIAEYYLAPPWEAHALMLPPGAGERPRTLVVRGEGARPATLSERQERLYELLDETPREVGELRSAVGARGFDATFGALVRRGLAERRYELARPRGRPRIVEVVRLAADADRARTFAANIEGRRASRRGRALRALLDADGEAIPFDELGRIARGAPAVETLISDGLLEIDGQRNVRLALDPAAAEGRIRELTRTRAQAAGAALLERLAGEPAIELRVSELAREFGAGAGEAVEHLRDAGLIQVAEMLDERDPLRDLDVAARPPVELLHEQRAAGAAIRAAIDRGDGGTLLLNGVTGSGKTEVYLDALAHTVSLGRRGIALVPEIALTPQTVRRFAERFPGRVGVLHSGLSLGEAYDQWTQIAAGKFDVVIGSRSAIFAPQPDLGLIVVDEGHEWTYKQHDPAPRYDARTVAEYLGALTGAAVVFGTATPDAERWYAAAEGHIERIDLPRRLRAVRQPGGETQLWPAGELPEIEIVDVRGARELLSGTLAEAIGHALDRDEQALLFLNRRGLAGFLLCARGHSPACSSCDVSLALHHPRDAEAGSVGRLICHQCSRSRPAPTRCEECGGALRPAQAGTQAVEREVRRLFPTARIVRWDRDTARRQSDHDAILGQLQRHEADVLVGTQMIAKGLDLPLVTLVGVVLADYGLRSGDFRARERTFQLLTQVAGRAGRADLHGRVIVQTLAPEDRVVEAVAAYDADGFFEEELRWRAEFRYPPFTRLARLVFGHTNAAFAVEEAHRMRDELRRVAAGLPGVDVLGPAPPQIARRRGRHRWALLVRAPDPGEVLREVELPLGWTVDVDPVLLD